MRAPSTSAQERKQAKVEARNEGDREAKENSARGRGFSHGGPGELRKLGPRR
jgi:hypothetical protein